MNKLFYQIREELQKGRSVLLNGYANNYRYLLDRICALSHSSNAITFDGNAGGIYYKSEYISPCNRFDEIKKLILAVNTVKGLRYDFCGILLLDISDWLGHESENYFSVFLKFLYDKNPCWKYVFLLDSNDERKISRMHKEILGILRCSCISANEHNQSATKSVIRRVCGNAGVRLSAGVEEMLCSICIKHNLSEQTVENLVDDIICETQSELINISAVNDYFKNPQCIYSCFFPKEDDKEKGCVIRG